MRHCGKLRIDVSSISMGSVIAFTLHPRQYAVLNLDSKSAGYVMASCVVTPSAKTVPTLILETQERT